MRVLVTGAAGGVGRHVLQALSADAEVVAFDLVSGPDQKRVRWVTGDILDFEAIAEAVKGCDSIVHLAAIPIYQEQRNLTIGRINILGTQTVFEAAVKAGVRRVVQASSICATAFIFWSKRRVPAYFPVDEEYADLPDDMYGLSKVISEQIAAAYEQRYGLETTSFRMAAVWAPDLKTTQDELSVLLDESMDEDLEFRDLRWQYVDVRDVARAYAFAVHHPRGLGVCNLGAADSPGGDWKVWVNDLYPDVPTLKHPAQYLADPSLPLWSIARVTELAGYRPEHTWREYSTFVTGYERYLERRGLK